MEAQDLSKQFDDYYEEVFAGKGFRKNADVLKDYFYAFFLSGAGFMLAEIDNPPLQLQRGLMLSALKRDQLEL